MSMLPPVSSSCLRARNGRTDFHPSLSIDAPMAARPRTRYVWSNCMYQGISNLHPPHHVAQKSSRTTFPLRAARETVWPCASVRAKSGAGLRAAGGISDSADAVAVLSPACEESATKMVKTPINESAIRFIVWHLFSTVRRNPTVSHRRLSHISNARWGAPLVTARRDGVPDGRLHSGAWFLLRNGCAVTPIRC